MKANPDWLSGYDQRVKVTIDNTDVDSTLTNFPVLIYLSTSSGRNNDDVSFVFDELTSDDNRKKIAVTTSDEVTECYVDLEKWDDANEQAWIWVKVPSISSSADTDLYLYYDKDHANNTDYVDDSGVGNATNVWDSNFKGVWHLNETTGTQYDATTNNNDASASVQSQGGASIIDGGDDLEVDSSHYVDCGTGASLRITPDITLEIWMKVESKPSATVGIAGRWETTDNDRCYGLYFGATNYVQWGITDDGSWTEGHRELCYDNTIPTDDVWYYYAGTFDGSASASLIYRNGTDVTTAIQDEGITTINQGTVNYDIGCQRTEGTRYRFLDGWVDEIRVSDNVRPSEWVKATYETGRDDLLDFGSEETDQTAPIYQNVGSNSTSIVENASILLYGQGYDDIALDWAWLATNETGGWQNYTDYHTDIVEYKEDITGTDLDAEQGVCTDGTNLFITSTTRLRKYGMSGGSKLADIDAFHGDTDVVHAGDCCHFDGKIYCICTNYPNSTVRRVYIYSASDLSYVNDYNITDNPASGTEISGIGCDGSYFWLCTWYGQKIYKYNSTFVYQNEYHQLSYVESQQGITFENDKLYVVTNDNAISEYSTSDWSLIGTQQNTVAKEGLDIEGNYLYSGGAHTAGDDALKKFDYHQLGAVHYDSPIDMNDVADTWTWSNFTWTNSSISAGTTIQWRIYYNDTSANENVTSIQSFTIQADPEINQLRLSVTTDDTNITSISVNTYYHWEVNVTDGNTLEDLKNVTIRIENNPANTILEDSPTFTEASEYWFRYDNATDAWEWYSGSAWSSTETYLNISGCVKPTLTETNGWYKFNAKLSEIASHTSTWEFSAYVFDSEDSNDTATFSSITVYFYTEITVESSHAWVDLSPGDVNQTTSEGVLSVSDGFASEGKVASKDNVYVNTTGGYVRLVIPYDSVVDTTAGPLGMLPQYRFSFYANGRFWVFYSDGSKMRFKTSVDGVTWSSSTQVRSAGHWDCFNIFYDTVSDRVHYACTPLVAGNIFFRSGTPNADGSITWIAAEEEIPTTYEYAFYVHINVDAYGVVWISYQDRTALSGGSHYPYVVKSGNNNGTWGTTPAGFPHQLSTTNDATWRVLVVRELMTAEMYVIYARDGEQPLGKNWKGTYWESEENDVTDYPIYADSSGHPLMSASNVGAVIYFVYVRDTTMQIRFNYRGVSGGWQANDELVQDDTTSLMFPAITPVSGTLQYCFWGNSTSDKIHYKKRVSGTWDTDPTEWISAPNFDPRAISSFYEDYDDKIGMLYLNSSSVPIGIRFYWMDLGDTSGTLYSTNLLSAKSVASIDQFNYTVSSLPAQTTLEILFSQDNSTWKNSTDGTSWQSLSSGTNNTIDLSGLSWSGANFYYKCGFNNTDDSTPKLNYIAINYTQLGTIIDITIIANANVDLQAKGNGTLSDGNGHTIALSNVRIHNNTLANSISLTTSYQDIPDLTDLAAGESSHTCVLWITIPDGTEDGDYVYTLTIKVVEHD